MAQNTFNIIILILLIILIGLGIYYYFFYKDPLVQIKENVKTNVKAEENNINVPQCPGTQCPQREIINGVATGRIICVPKSNILSPCTNFDVTVPGPSLIYSLHR